MEADGEQDMNYSLFILHYNHNDNKNTVIIKRNTQQSLDALYGDFISERCPHSHFYINMVYNAKMHLNGKWQFQWK